MSTTAITTTGKKGDIRIAFGFMKVKDHGVQPALHLFTKWNQQVLVQIPCTSMHEYDERDRGLDGEPKCLKRCGEIAEMLYGQPTSYGAARVLDAITEWMTDVKNLPPPSTFRNSADYLEYMKQHGFDIAEETGA